MSRLAVVVVLALGLIACTYAAPERSGAVFTSGNGQAAAISGDDKGSTGIFSSGGQVGAVELPAQGAGVPAGASGSGKERTKRGSSSAAASSSGGGSSSAAAASSSG